MAPNAWVTLTTNDSYALGALVLAHSLKRVGTRHELAILVTPGVSQAMKTQLQAAFNHVEEVDVLDSKDIANLKLLTRPELGITFTKLHCWRLTQYEKCVFLDADTLVLQNCDELFDKEEFSAAPDAGWPDCFNSGVFVFRPSLDTFSTLIDFAIQHGSFDGGDQGLLNQYFSDWATKDISKHLSFVYNMCSTATYSYLPALKQYGQNIKIIHFIGTSKPWLHPFNTETRLVSISETTVHLAPFLQTWWDLFCTTVHPVLSSEMTSIRLSSWYSPQSFSSSNPPSSIAFSNIPEVIPFPTAEPYIFKDPWDDFVDNGYVTDSYVETSQNYVDYNNDNHYANHYGNDASRSDVFDTGSNHNANYYGNDTSRSDGIDTSSNYNHHENHDHHIHQNADIHHQSYERHDQHESAQNSSSNDTSSNPSHFPSPVNSSQSQVEPSGNHDDTGIAGALSQLKLGSPGSLEKAIFDDQLRRQSWEQGLIDYMGRDAFRNIWDKICKTVGGAPSQPEEEAEAQSNLNLEPTSPTTSQVSVTAIQTNLVGSTKTEVTAESQSATQGEISSEGKKPAPSPISTTEIAPTSAQPATPTVTAPTPPLSPAAGDLAESVEALKVSGDESSQPPVPPKRHQKKSDDSAASSSPPVPPKEDSNKQKQGKGGKGKK